jgi:cell division protein FtsW (lipid II flippase)
MIRSIRMYDPVLFALALVASVLGLVFIFDAGYARSLQMGRGMIPREFVSQVIYLIAALGAGFLAARVNPEKWMRCSKVIWLISLILLLGVEYFGFTMNGAQRWIKIGYFNFQPAEFVKIATILYLAGAFATRATWPSNVPRYKNRLLWIDNVLLPKLKRSLPAVWVLIAVYLIEKEPDLGTAAMVAVIAYVMFFLGGVSRRSMMWISVLGLMAIVGLAMKEPYRMARIENHTSRWSMENMDDIGYQTVQAEVAYASGGILGVGFGAGRAKHVMPAATTDFIPATIGEELGLCGALLVIGVLGGLSYRLITLAPRAPTKFGSLVLGGAGAWIGLQSCVNFMMANGTLPAIGIPLPFISSGGSSLIALWIAIGICQSMLRPQPIKEEALAAGDDRRRHGRTRLSSA